MPCFRDSKVQGRRASVAKPNPQRPPSASPRLGAKWSQILFICLRACCLSLKTRIIAVICMGRIKAT